MKNITNESLAHRLVENKWAFTHINRMQAISTKVPETYNDLVISFSFAFDGNWDGIALFIHTWKPEDHSAKELCKITSAEEFSLILESNQFLRAYAEQIRHLCIQFMPSWKLIRD